MDEDGVTVKATFSLGYVDDMGGRLDRYWYFIRIYMEEGPEKLVNKFRFCLPIADRKEPLAWGINNYINKVGPLFYLMFPLMAVTILGRFLAMHTSRIPVWPDWVEEKCRIDPNDRYVRDASTNPPVCAFTNLHQVQSPLIPYKPLPNIIGVILASILGCISTGLFMWLVVVVKMNM